MIDLKYTIKDFKSDNEVRWCAGCGDFAILNAIQRTMAELGVPHEKFAIISGIGCSSRFPYYMNTYGVHSIHGRAAAVATGTKLANPDLSVWVITGDGDALAIGGNHTIHAIRRNVDMNVILFNNEIYGLTKGQFSPTSLLGQKTKTSPFGNTQPPFNPGELALGAGARFFARISGNKPKELTAMFIQAEQFKGLSFIEVLQNCVIFNDGAFDKFNKKETRPDNQVYVVHGEKMIFGHDSNKGLRLNGLKLEVVTIGENGITENDILVHDAHESDPTLHFMLTRMKNPIVTGIIRSVEEISFDERFVGQMEERIAASTGITFDDLVESGETYML